MSTPNFCDKYPMITFRAFTENMAPGHHTDLNPRLWDRDQRLKTEVREALLRFAKAWVVFAKVPENVVKGTILVGGSASHYYNEHSDIDVHVIVDIAAMGSPTLVNDLLRDRKQLWGLKHRVMVKGLPVEPYCQPLGEPFPVGQGVFDLDNDKWLQKPSQSQYDPSTDVTLDPKIEHWRRVIEKVINQRRSIEDAERVKTRLARYRAAGLVAHGDAGPENFVFKAIRNMGLISQLKNYITELKDGSLSLK